MKNYGYLIVFFCVGISISQSLPSKFGRDDSELKLVVVLFRHGDRTPAMDRNETYPTDPYANFGFYPEGLGQLTNLGKRRAYRFGQLLRTRYSDFLGTVYLQEHVYARSTSIIRSKMSLLLVLAGLYPPAHIQKWNLHLNWQPINTINIPITEDGLLLPFFCPPYKEAFQEAMNTDEMIAEMNRFDDLATILMKYTGERVCTLWNMYFLYHAFVAETTMGLPLPTWAKELFPNGGLRAAAVLRYEANSYNTVLNRRNGGIFLRRVIEDMRASINGTVGERKINLYSAQDMTITAALQALGLYNGQIPGYCSSVIFELRYLRGKYHVKVLYHLGIPEKTIEMKIPGCDTLCPLEKFIELRQHVIPSGDELQCDKPEPAEF